MSMVEFPDIRQMAVKDSYNFHKALTEHLSKLRWFCQFHKKEKESIIRDVCDACLTEIRQYPLGTPLTVREVALNALPEVLAAESCRLWLDSDAFRLGILANVKDALYTVYPLRQTSTNNLQPPQTDSCVIA